MSTKEEKSLFQSASKKLQRRWVLRDAMNFSRCAKKRKDTVGRKWWQGQWV